MQFFVFIGCAPGKTSIVGQSIAAKEMPQVLEIFSVSGDWDLLVRVRFSGDDFETNVIETMLDGQWDNVQKTHTVIGYRVYSPNDASF